MPIGINYNAGVSAQLKSAVIFAGLNSYGHTNIIEKQKSRQEKNREQLEDKKNKDPIKFYKSFNKKPSTFKALYASSSESYSSSSSNDSSSDDFPSPDSPRQKIINQKKKNIMIFMKN